MAGALIGRSSTLRNALRAVAKKYDVALQEVVRVQMEITIDDLRSTTPVDTGAGAGTINGAKRDMYFSHPGYGMHIGNNPGDTGWQMEKENDVRRWAITNPMWVPYLRVVNYTHPTHGNFLENAVKHLQNRLRNLNGVKV